MVFSVCQRVLHHWQDAEDACQATFLVLARKATSSRWRESVANWLYKTACHVALRARTASRRRAAHEGRARHRAPADPLADISLRELQAVLDEELARLPAKYRAPIILCCLEGTARDEAAKHLGWTLQKVKDRLERGRELLRARLARRGLTLSALLAGTTLTQSTAQSALSLALISSTSKAATLFASGKTAGGAVSLKVATLAEGMSKAMFLTKIKMATALLLAVGVLAAGAGAAIQRKVAAQPAQTQQEAPKHRAAASALAATKQNAGKPATAPAMDEKGDLVTFTGRVLDPDGKPFEGAEISIWWHYGFWIAWHPKTVKPRKPRILGKSGPGGGFRVSFDKAEIDDTVNCGLERPWRHCQIVAAARGHGPGWRGTYDLYQKELTLSLARDDIPIKGRVLDLQGRPVASASVRVEHLVLPQERDYLWSNSWEGLPADARTDKNGRFTLTGIGRERGMLLHVEGQGIEHKVVSAATRLPVDGKKGDNLVEVVVGPTKPIEGSIRAKETGKPLSGVVIYGNQESNRRGVWAITDQQGRYRLLGLGKSGSYELAVFPQGGLPYLTTVRTVADSEGLKPLTADFELRRGVPVRFRLIDKETRKTVRRTMQYTPLAHNPYYSEAVYAPGALPSREFMRVRSPDKDGYFNFVAYPGPGFFITNTGYGSTPYLQARLKPADKEKFKRDPMAEFVSLTEAYGMIDADTTDKPLIFELELDPGRKVSGSLIDPDGKPVSGATAYGLSYYGPRYPGGEEVLNRATFTALGLAAGEPRTLTFVNKERKLIGHVVLQGNEERPVTVFLRPWGVLIGRLVDAEAKPLPKVRVKAWHGMPSPGIWPPDASGGEVETDSQGRFRLEYLDSTLKRELLLSGGLSGGERLKNLPVRAGEVKDLGDIPVKVMPAKKDKRE